MSKKSIYLAGGGARGAYHAGVLKALNEILKVKTLPFNMVSGVSVGSINAGVLAEQADDFPAAVEKMEYLWGEITCQQIFNSSNYALSKSVVKNLGHLVIKNRQSGHLLDTGPLHYFISDNINFTRIQSNIDHGFIETLEVISQCYETHETISFYDHHKMDFDDWNYPRHSSQRTHIEQGHILASSSLPLFFPAANVDGFHYGDGSMGLVSPLRGCIRFKMNKVLILGTRDAALYTKPEHLRNGDIGFANILGGMMNGLFIDNLDRDIEMVNRMNDIAQRLSLWKKRNSPWRPIETLYLRPSTDVAAIAQAQYKIMPGLLRFLLNMLGANSHSGDLLSFLLFEKEFTRELITLGYNDTLQQAPAIEAFFA